MDAAHRHLLDQAVQGTRLDEVLSRTSGIENYRIKKPVIINALEGGRLDLNKGDRVTAIKAKPGFWDVQVHTFSSGPGKKLSRDQYMVGDDALDVIKKFSK